MKKITQQLLTTYPLIWNTRVYLMLPVLIVLHILYFLAGLFREYNMSIVSEYGIDPGRTMTMFSILLGGLLLLLWLAFYLRHNALKRLYPITNGKLFAEFLIILVTSLGAISLVESYRVGSYISFNKTFRQVDVVKEGNTANLARFFLAFNFDDFHTSNSCENRRKQAVAKDADETPIATTHAAYSSLETMPDSLGADFSFLNY